MGKKSQVSPFRLAALFALPLAVLFAAASLGNLVLEQAYAGETASWAAQGRGQDWIDLVVVSPLLVVVALAAGRGSRRAVLLLGGIVSYTAYSLVLYAFAVHFNQLFLVYSIALGLSFYSLVSLVAALGRQDVRSWFPARAPAVTAGGFCILLGASYYALWLSEVVPALASGIPPRSLAEVGLITNPVQVLDLGIVLPAFVAGGIALVRGKALGYWLVPVMLAFGAVMDLALIAMSVSLGAGNMPGPERIPMFAVMGALDVAILWLFLRHMTDGEEG